MLGTCDQELAPGDAPDWVHLFPSGHIRGRDGRAFDLEDPGAVILAFEGAGVDLPVDYEHQNDRPEAKLSGPIPAAGWIKQLEAREDGIWGKVEWTATARELIGNREYRYLSPSFYCHPKTRAIVRLRGAGLVHNPNFHLHAIASEEVEMTDTPDYMTTISELLGLPPDADPAAIIDAIRTLLDAGQEKMTAHQVAPDPREFVPIEALQDLMSDRTSKAVLAAEERADVKVQDALNKGYITPGMKGWALALARKDQDSFDTFLASSMPMFAHLTRQVVPNGPPHGAESQPTSDPYTLAICAQLGLAPEKLR